MKPSTTEKSPPHAGDRVAPPHGRPPNNGRAGRFCVQLLAFTERYGEPDDATGAGSGGIRIILRLTQTDLTELVGASRERVNQVMVKVRQKGCLSVDASHHVHVHQIQALARRCK